MMYLVRNMAVSIIRVNALFAFLNTFTAVVDICMGCIPLATPMAETSGHILAGHTYETLKARTLVVCAVRCMRQRKCVSFNYHMSESKCGLNDESHLTASADMKEISTDDVVYYDIRQWDQKWLGSCRNHDCPTETICESVTGGIVINHVCSATYSADIPTGSIDFASLGVCTLTDGCADCTEPEVVSSRTYSAVGCYRHDVLPHLLTNLRGSIDWTDVAHFQNIVNTCASLSTGYDYFGIEYYGECYAGSSTEATFQSPISADSCNTDCLYLGVGVGSGDVMFVYKWD